ncbi:MAG: hypothetical protein KDA89_01080 [Planctomycetaceae bacterium]|nr:hypothetical protein [Planctomycetaceae bacterium]
MTARLVRVPLKRPVRHASHLRTENDTLLVRCELSDGSIGWGEALPRIYVTGESADSVVRQLEATDFEPLTAWSFDSPETAIRAVTDFRPAMIDADAGVTPRECFGNSVRCAVELAVLDAVCRAHRVSVGELLRSVAATAGLATQRSDVVYSGVITSVNGRIRQYRSAIKMKVFGFRNVKVKVGTDGVNDVLLLKRIRSVVGRSTDLRTDANEAWHCEEVVDRLRQLAQFRVTCVEQPVPHAEISGLAEIRRELKRDCDAASCVAVMLDESLCSPEDADRAIEGQICDMFNLRISKCGGLIPCLKIAQRAAAGRIGCQLGCMVGESGILSAAGRHFAANVSGLRFVEGSYGRFLVRDQLTYEDLTFGYGGRAAVLSGIGLGITVDEGRVAASSLRELRLL